jgi:hypothetical protein
MPHGEAPPENGRRRAERRRSPPRRSKNHQFQNYYFLTGRQTSQDIHPKKQDDFQKIKTGNICKDL